MTRFHSKPCSNWLWSSIRVSTAKLIAEKWIHRLRSRSQLGQQQARLIGGSKSASNGSVECVVQTVGNGGLKLLIFGPSQEDQ